MGVLIDLTVYSSRSCFVRLMSVLPSTFPAVAPQNAATASGHFKQYRKQQGLAQEQIAGQLQVSTRTLARRERGEFRIGSA